MVGEAGPWCWGALLRVRGLFAACLLYVLCAIMLGLLYLSGHPHIAVPQPPAKMVLKPSRQFDFKQHPMKLDSRRKSRDTSSNMQALVVNNVLRGYIDLNRGEKTVNANVARPDTGLYQSSELRADAHRPSHQALGSSESWPSAQEVHLKVL